LLEPILVSFVGHIVPHAIGPSIMSSSTVLDATGVMLEVLHRL